MTAISLLLLELSGCEFLPFIDDSTYADRFDLDHDGVARPDDCDDKDPSVGIVKQYVDVDGDGYGFGVAVVQCELIDGYAPTDGDCNDQDATINSDASEICDGIDNDCDEQIDVDPVDGSTWYADLDGDGYGDPASSFNLCAQQTGTVADATDCNDSDVAVNPAATEVCEDNVDNNCDGQVDEGTSYTTQYADVDSDGYGDVNTQVVDCHILAGHVLDSTDCNDNDATVNPSVEEICNDGIDNNCDESPNDCTFEGEIVASNAIGILTGEASYDYAGWSVAGAGDVDNDGYDDVMVSALYHNSGATHSGIVYIVRGPITGESSLSDAYATFTGIAENDYAGNSVVNAGDLDADGNTDFVIGANGSSLYEYRGGAVFIMHGPVSGMQSLSSAYRILTGRINSATGTSVAGVGDINSDGYDDVLIGAAFDDHAGTTAGAAYIDFGPGTNVTTDMETAGDLILDGEQTSDYAGISVASAGDVNADGIPDILVGAVGNDDAGRFAGAVYLLYGPLSGNTTLSLADANMKFTGEDSENKLGSAMSTAGDMNNDGNDDFLIGANNESGSGSGIAYLVVTATSGTESIATNGYKLMGESPNDQTGYSVSSASDLDQDGNNDLLIGAPRGDVAGLDDGIVYCVFGPVSAGTTQLSDSKTILQGEVANDLFGLAVAPVSDVNADGFPDIIVGAGISSRGLPNAGAAYIFSWLQL